MDMYPERMNDGDRSSGRRHTSRLLKASLSALLVAMSSFAAGCRGGATSFAAPSWWSLGGTNLADAAKLTAAPPFEGKAGAIEKPSVSATPYPTTTTPTSYDVADLAKGSTGATPPALVVAAEQQPVIYGTTPPPQAAQPAAVAGNPIPQKVGEAQVGPYASLSGQPASSTPPMAPATASAPLSAPMTQSKEPQAASAGSAFPATAGYEPAVTRVADSRGADPYRLPAGPSDALPADAEASRYSNSSRFGGGQNPAVSAPPSTVPFTPMAAPTAPIAAPTVPMAVPTAPMAAPTAPMAAPTAPPVRRPDPGYRPASTSSYRPSEAIFVESAPASPPSAVRTAAYEVPALPER